ncbi:MAG: bifunctional adenosylcobinamide kinase/adenosylcobinamide-phosphate guanylyltransferase [Lachnospiraceae bacterium]|nr:bifunctional adenosylcobinamide kinase/adenosylcobinamide-phosphate guanylyltransferase [Lachnospiraceae bacterium]
MFTVVIGGSASDKSEYAEQHVVSLPGKRIYLATMMPWDEECIRRIAKHREGRKERGFSTVEQYTRLEDLNLPADGNVLLEDLGNLLSNTWYARGEDETAEPGRQAETGGAATRSGRFATECASGEVLRGIDHLLRSVAHLTLVTNEIGLGGADYSEQTLLYMEQLGRLNRKLAKRADQVVEVICGLPVILKENGE